LRQNGYPRVPFSLGTGGSAPRWRYRHGQAAGLGGLGRPLRWGAGPVPGLASPSRSSPRLKANPQTRRITLSGACHATFDASASVTEPACTAGRSRRAGSLTTALVAFGANILVAGAQAVAALVTGRRRSWPRRFTWHDQRPARAAAPSLLSPTELHGRSPTAPCRLLPPPARVGADPPRP